MDWTLNKVLDKLANKRKGSKAFKKAQDHRENHINWSVNQLNFNMRRLNYEKVKWLRHKSSCSRKSSHWTYKLIDRKVERRCEEEDVLLNLDDSTYMSQRCSSCGLVLKSNRKGSTYFCKNCGYEDDADFNSSHNHQQELFKLPFGFRDLKLNIKGFFWRRDGVYGLDGEELSVPLSKNERIAG